MDKIKIFTAVFALVGCIECSTGINLTAKEAISCISDIDKAVSVCYDLKNYDEITYEDIYDEFAKVDIFDNEVIFTENEVLPKIPNIDFTKIKQGRVEAITYYLCDKIGIKLPFENTFTSIINYDNDAHYSTYYFSPYHYTNYQMCCTFMNMAEDIFCNEYSFCHFYERLSPAMIYDEGLEKTITNIKHQWRRYDNYCRRNIYISNCQHYGYECDDDFDI